MEKLIEVLEKRNVSNKGSQLYYPNIISFIRSLGKIIYEEEKISSQNLLLKTKRIIRKSYSFKTNKIKDSIIKIIFKILINKIYLSEGMSSLITMIVLFLVNHNAKGFVLIKSLSDIISLHKKKNCFHKNLASVTTNFK